MTRRLEAAITPDERHGLLRMMAICSPQSWEHFNILGEYDFSKREAAGQHRCPVPKIIPEKLGAAKSVNLQPVQRKMKCPMAESVPMCV